jgi:uncharacterized protein YecT (DUF1311 family)
MKYLIILLLLLPFSAYSSAEDVTQTEHPLFECTTPIDVSLSVCYDKNTAFTSGTTRCLEEAREQWEKEMNVHYAFLLKTLDPQPKRNLIKSQKAWLKYRDAEFENINTIYNTVAGTFKIPKRESDKMEVVRDRALSLKYYHDDIFDDTNPETE